MDAIRLELVQKLAKRLKMSDDTLHQFALSCKGKRQQIHSEVPDDAEDPYLDADVEIVKAFQEATIAAYDEAGEEEEVRIKDEAMLVISKDGTGIVESATPPLGETEELMAEAPDPKAVEDAYQTARDMTDYLPQLVAAVLKSPPAFQPQLMDPIRKLRRLILTRCLQDANWGIELCWLLEAEVGRAWKTLFEHRQQTGRRLIVVLPAEKAAVLAKIGTEKREAFDLLQDAEQATAYGYTFQNVYDTSHHGTPQSFNSEAEPTPPKLPSSLSLRRCSHFGDTMHFIDKLTQISMDLRMVPVVQRHDYLQECLQELNRRLRRRMITRGDVSLDVEDNRGANDWPQISDMNADVIKYSVHFPLIPKRGTWPAGLHNEDHNTMADKTDAGTMRVLNIVAPESRILASRERCPYLVHLEVADTGLEGRDARLYAPGSYGVGTTVEETIGMNPRASSAAAATTEHYQQHAYRIPLELVNGRLVDSFLVGKKRGYSHDDSDDDSDGPGRVMIKERAGEGKPRGGWQYDEGMYYPPESSDYLYSNPYDNVRQLEYERLHQEMQPPVYQAPPPTQERQMLTTKSALLERVYGLPWAMQVEQIRQMSPYGNVKGWRLASFIMKAGEDIRREALVMQVIEKMNEWFKTDIPEKHRPMMRPYTIMCVGGEAGMLECLSDAKSIDEVKKKTDGFLSLRDYFERAYGPPSQRRIPFQQPQYVSRHGSRLPIEYSKEQFGDISFEQAQDNFLRSLVGYSLVCYVMQIKDRHNANILLDRAGHIMHIDFGFVLGDTPKMGKVPLFSERAPFKLSTEFWEVLGGWNFHEGGLGVKFCKMFEIAFACAASHVEDIASIVEGGMLNLCRNANEARELANDVRSRLRMRGPAGSIEQKTFIMNLVNGALTSWGTPTYDWIQKTMNGYQ